VRRALITGIGGQDGGYLAEALVASGVEVHGLARRGETTDVGGRIGAATLHEGDLTDEDALRNAVRAADPDDVYHLAGVSSVAQSWEQPVRTADVTGLGTARLLEAVWQHQRSAGRGVRFLLASSAEIFGEPASWPQDEATPLSPTSPYGAAKAFAHHLVGVYRGRGLHAVATILYNHESPRRPTSFVTRKITHTVAQIASGRAEELVLGSLESRRDWGWAPDYVDAMVRALSHDEPQDFVVATGQEHSVADFVAAAFARAGIDDWQRHVRSDPAFVRPADPSLMVGDASRARRVLGWVPTVSFEELVGRMVDHDLDVVHGGTDA
jgi:GDPmannose 4,6-dehydratase